MSLQDKGVREALQKIASSAGVAVGAVTSRANSIIKSAAGKVSVEAEATEIEEITPKGADNPKGSNKVGNVKGSGGKAKKTTVDGGDGKAKEITPKGADNPKGSNKVADLHWG